jgi:hypothetical protein
MISDGDAFLRGDVSKGEPDLLRFPLDVDIASDDDDFDGDIEDEEAEADPSPCTNSPTALPALESATVDMIRIKSSATL